MNHNDGNSANPENRKDEDIDIRQARLLMVDDIPENLDVLRRVLTPEGYRLSFADNGERALILAARIVPELILLDVMMPGIDGFETCRRLKQQPQTKDIPVIFITAKIDTDDLVNGFKAGAVDYLVKPFNHKEICIRVHTHLQNRMLIRQRERLNTQLAEKNRLLEELPSKLSKYISPQIYQSIFSGEKEVKIETHRKKLTVFFSDIVGFTELTDSIESESLSMLLNNYLNEMSKIALKHGGTIDKFIGDAIMIFFGDPETKGAKEDALSCLCMALEMRERIKTLQKAWDEQGTLRPLSIRTGINTGYCTVGNFGSEDRLDYTIIGGQVNLAQRLESNAETDQILISHETYALVKDQVRCEKKQEVMVKGIAHPVQLYQVVDLCARIPDELKQIKEEQEGFSLSVNLTKIEKSKAVALLEKAVEKIK
ncbi:MAG: adenylate/guanylate cyclase domain-containing response regulator [Gammaproteobacteria bacterium]|nr:adenylate/guanylate cyclase domain-containing response regulator [Gammaproteobacteria bacterium]